MYQKKLNFCLEQMQYAVLHYQYIFYHKFFFEVLQLVLPTLVFL